MSKREETRRRLNPSFWLSLFFFAVIAVGVMTATQWRWDTRLFPWVVGIPALALTLWQLIADLRGSRAAADPEEGAPRSLVDVPIDESIPETVRFERTLKAMAWILGFIFSIWLMGFLIAIPLFVFCYLKLEARAATPMAILLALTAEFFVWGVFDAIMHLAWPEAALFRLFR
jgi:hypothetical protein